jgi:uncharacterized protein (DUF1015 family)
VAEISAFRALRFDPNAVGDLASVVSPPYDVISDGMREELEDASPHNIVRLVLGREEPGDDERTNKYTRARALLESWRAAGVLSVDDTDSLTVYEMRYTVGGEARVSRGILAAVGLGEPEDGGVLPHERTYADIVDDRLALLRATATNLDCIFCVYDGRDAAAHETLDRVCAADPDASFITPDGIEHLIWRVTDAGDIATVARSVEKTQIVIADGHHRHRTAERYRTERRASDGAGPWDAQLMYLVDASRFGPSLLPIHRVLDKVSIEDVVARLGEIFQLEEVHGDADEVAAIVATRRGTGRAFGLISATTSYIATVVDVEAERKALPSDRSAAWRELDVSVLHHLVFDTLLGGATPRFVHHPHEVADEIRAGRATIGFLLAPMAFDAVRAVAEAGDAMPQKSTYFIPKPATGVVLRPLG